MTTGYSALAIGGSAGSLSILRATLEGLCADTQLAVVVCVHTASRDVRQLCDVLARHTALPVEEAAPGAPVAPGRVHVASGGYHLLVEHDRTFSLCAGERVQYARPSIDVLFESMADVYRYELAALLLSGANADGAEGLHAVHRAGGLTLIQHPDFSLVADMPKAALALFEPDRQNTPEQLQAAVKELSRYAR